MASYRAPKQWQLTKIETITTFENWRQNLIYTLSLDSDLAAYLVEGVTWRKKTAASPTRGFTNDGTSVPIEQRKTATQKAAQLDLMLGQIANFCPVIARNSIVKNSVSLPDIWQKIRQHYGFQTSGAHFLDLANIKPEVDERPEDLFQRISAFFEDNLLTTHGGILHHGSPVDADEDLSPSLENTIVLLWLQLVHPGLPQLVKQKYGHELRNKTLSSLKPEISQALGSLLEELNTIEESRVMRFSAGSKPFSRRKTFKSCTLCKTAGRSGSSSHTLTECRYLPEHDRRALARSRLVCEDDEDLREPDDDQTEEHEHTHNPLLDKHMARRVNIIQSPYLHVYYKQHPMTLTIDTGATTNLLRISYAKRLGLPITPASQLARQADGVTPLDVVGEVHGQLTRGSRTFTLDALVVKRLDVDIIAGNPFLVTNDVAVRPAKRQIIIHGEEVVMYGDQAHENNVSSVRRTQSFLLRSPNHQTVLLPGEYVEVNTPSNTEPDTVWALEPRFDSTSNSIVKETNAWPPPQVVQSVGNTVRLTNASCNPVILRRSEHFCQIRAVTTPDTIKMEQDTQQSPMVGKQSAGVHSSMVSVDPDGVLSSSMQQEFREMNKKFEDVFNPQISKYNGASGKIEAVVNMGPVLPPQRKGRLPHYNRDKLNDLQQKFDELEESGVFAKPEEVGVTVEYLNLSFLVQKPSGGTRLVTSFGEVGQYSKPQPSLMPNIDDTLRAIASWKYIIVTDLLKSFYQIPLSKASMKFCGVATPFKGIRVYTRCAMGMPGSETSLEELMCRVLGDLIQHGNVAKIADDLYCGGSTPQEVLHTWSCVLAALSKNNLRLSATKTIICPKTANILGWVWSQGTLRASTHRIAALSSVDTPQTVQGLRSFIGACKVLSRVIKGYAGLLHPLDCATAGKQSRDRVLWDDTLLQAFKNVQSALKDNKTITVPLPEDTLWIVTDGSVKNNGIGATLYVLRKDTLLLAGFFNAKLRKHQVTWLPCEVEALCIGTAVKHFAPYIIQSKYTAQVLTDSRPCVQAYQKLCRGEFSTSSRVTSFLSTVSRYQVHIGHIAGVANLPSDFASRHPAECRDHSCQVCKFIAEVEESVVLSISVKDVADGLIRMPFTSRAAWLATQLECPDLRRTHSHLTQGTRPTKKVTNIPDVKRYLQCVRIGGDGLLTVKDETPFQRLHERIVVPRSVIDGLLTAIHIRFNHPSHYQMKQLVSRYFFALDLDRAIEAVTGSCHHCASLKAMSTSFQTQTSTIPPDKVGVSFAADIMRRYRQYIFVLRETVTSFTFTTTVESEKHADLRDALLLLCAEVRSLSDVCLHVRTDPAPGFLALAHDSALQKAGITLEVGCAKNTNKNPVAERAIQELGLELLHLHPEGGPMTRLQLAMATANMNTRIRHSGLSARELWTQRDQVTGEQLPIDDRRVIWEQYKSRANNHEYSARSKARGQTQTIVPHISVGDLVYLAQDKDKTKARDKYLVTTIDDEWCQVRKFTKSEFRAKAYDVRISDCYPVVPSTLGSRHTGPIRGIDNPLDIDSEPDVDYAPISQASENLGPQTIPTTSPVSYEQPPGAIIQPLSESPATLTLNQSNTAPLEQCKTPESPSLVLRRSSRTNKGQPPSRYEAL